VHWSNTVSKSRSVPCTQTKTADAIKPQKKGKLR